MNPLSLPQRNYSRSQADTIAYGIRKIFPGVYCTTIVDPLLGPVYRIAADESHIAKQQAA